MRRFLLVLTSVFLVTAFVGLAGLGADFGGWEPLVTIFFLSATRHANEVYPDSGYPRTECTLWLCSIQVDLERISWKSRASASGTRYLGNWFVRNGKALA